MPFVNGISQGYVYHCFVAKVCVSAAHTQLHIVWCVGPQHTSSCTHEVHTLIATHRKMLQCIAAHTRSTQ